MQSLTRHIDLRNRLLRPRMTELTRVRARELLR